MKLKIYKYLISFFLFTFFLFSCDEIDILGLVASSDVDERFDNMSDLDDFDAPIIADINNYNFIVMSDTHYHEQQLGYYKIIEDHKDDWNISFAVTTGDHVQNGKSGAYKLLKQDLDNLTVPFYPVIGNHDIYNNGFEYYKKYFGRTMYDFIIGDIHYIFLDTANGTLGEYQKTWFEKKLKNSKCSNKIIFSHYSPIDVELESPTSMTYPEEAYFLIDICDRYNVDYFICGQLHHYDYNDIRGTKYIIINNRASGSNCYAKISVKNGKLSHDVF